MQHEAPTLSLVAYWVRMAIGSGEYFLVELERAKRELIKDFEEGRMRAE